MTEEIIKIDIDQIAEIGEFNVLDKVKVGQDMNRIIGMIIGEKILEITWECNSVLEDRIDENIEEIIGMTIITEKEVGEGLEKIHFQGT